MTDIEKMEKEWKIGEKKKKNTDLPPPKGEFAPPKLEFALPIMTVWLRACIVLEYGGLYLQHYTLVARRVIYQIDGKLISFHLMPKL